jgi:FdhE protein
VKSPARSSLSGRAAFDAGAARAEALARSSAAAAAPLRFAAGLLRAQGAAAAALESAHRVRPLTGRLEVDVDRVLEHALDVARFAAAHGPEHLADSARARTTEASDFARRRLGLYWAGEIGARDDYLSRAMLRPYVTTLRLAGVAPDRVHTRGHCPFCGGSPATSCRRSGAESDGSARSLVCALCGLEWPINRILCPACSEGEPRKLPSFTSEPHTAARIEACETCGRYMKSIDMSKDVHAVPEVDDVASIALDLWAVEQGYTRIEPGLAGM